MPEITGFFGIIIRTNGESRERHSVSHLYAYYQEQSVVYGIGLIVCLVGNRRCRRGRLPEAWMELHQQSLAKN